MAGTTPPKAAGAPVHPSPLFHFQRRASTDREGLPKASCESSRSAAKAHELNLLRAHTARSIRTPLYWRAFARASKNMLCLILELQVSHGSGRRRQVAADAGD